MAIVNSIEAHADNTESPSDVQAATETLSLITSTWTSSYIVVYGNGTSTTIATFLPPTNATKSNATTPDVSDDCATRGSNPCTGVVTSTGTVTLIAPPGGPPIYGFTISEQIGFGVGAGIGALAVISG